jgi:branched-chain amino acid transport system permease protein
MSEDLEFLLALVLNGASIGLMYSLIALGFVLVYKATDAINFAQGEFVMLAGLIVTVTLGFEGMPLLAAVVIVLAVMIAFGFGLERIVLRPLLGRPVVAVIMATIGLAAMLRGLGPVIFGSETRALSLPIGDEPITLGPASLPPIQVLGAVVAVVFMLGVDVQLALVGLKVFPVVILGGLDSVGGALVGGLIIGIVESLAAGYLDPYVGGGTKDFAPYVLMILVLMIRPYGIFGRRQIERV